MDKATYSLRKVNVYDDGKLSRATKATVIKAGSKRLLIRFYCDWREKEIIGWFNKVRRDKGGVYWHKDSNTWFYEHYETAAFREDVKDWFASEYYNEFFTGERND